MRPIHFSLLIRAIVVNEPAIFLRIISKELNLSLLCICYRICSDIYCCVLLVSLILGILLKEKQIMIGNKQDKSRTKIIKLYLAPLKLIDKGLSKHITLIIFDLMKSVANRKISDINVFHFF